MHPGMSSVSLCSSMSCPLHSSFEHHRHFFALSALADRLVAKFTLGYVPCVTPPPHPSLQCMHKEGTLTPEWSETGFSHCLCDSTWDENRYIQTARVTCYVIKCLGWREWSSTIDYSVTTHLALVLPSCFIPWRSG